MNCDPAFTLSFANLGQPALSYSKPPRVGPRWGATLRASWSGTPVPFVGPPQGATQNHCPNVNDKR